MRTIFLLLLLVFWGCDSNGTSENGVCDDVLCSNHGDCITDGFAPYCSCQRGFHPQQLSCVENDPHDPCNGVDCNHHGTCTVSEENLPQCSCDPGYRSAGRNLLCLSLGSTDPDADVDVQVDSNLPTDGDVDADRPLACPMDMVLIVPLNVCIDRFEASRKWGTRTALSVPNEDPWVQIRWTLASEACMNAKKRLCTATEWLTACGGPDEQTYPYGESFQPAYCNDSYNGYDYALPTGTMHQCEGFYDGLFDMVGNVAEWTSSFHEDGALVSLSTYHDEKGRLACNSFVNIPVTEDFEDLGFRCCLDL